MRADLFWIPGPWRGRLAITLRPRAGRWLPDDAEAWRSAGVDVVVSLLEAPETRQFGLAGELEAAARVGIQFHSFPIPDRDIPASQRDAVAFISHLATLLEAGRHVAIHCGQGIGRSRLVTVGVLTIAGASPEQAIRSVSAARGTPVPETPARLHWVLDLPSWMPAAKP